MAPMPHGRWIALIAFVLPPLGCELDDFDYSKIGGAAGAAGDGGSTLSTTSSTTATGSACDVAACPAPAADCMVAACANDTCVEEPARNGVLASTQSIGDCQRIVCIDGVPTPEDDASDIFDDGHECTKDTCNGSTPESIEAPLGSPCVGPGKEKVCDDFGVCVECNGDADCAAGLEICMGSMCIPRGPGSPCNNADECPTGFCVDGVCCDAACDGTCQACDLADSLGACTPFPAGDDPDGECRIAPNCDGNNACGLGPGGAPCLANAAGACVGPANCPSSMPFVCPPVASGGACIAGTMSCNAGADMCPIGGICP